MMSTRKRWPDVSRGTQLKNNYASKLSHTVISLRLLLSSKTLENFEKGP